MTAVRPNASACETACLYASILGPAWFTLEPCLQLLHRGPGVSARGRFRVTGGSHKLAGILARLSGLPRSGPSCDVKLVIDGDADAERWGRRFDGLLVRSLQRRCRAGLLRERFGFVECGFRLLPGRGSLVYRQEGAAFCVGPLRAPLPSWLSPRVEASEEVVGAERIRVQVRIALPLFGTLVCYEGVIALEAAS